MTLPNSHPERYVQTAQRRSVLCPGTAGAMGPGRAHEVAAQKGPLKFLFAVDWLFWVLPNARSVARLGQLDSSPSTLPPVETLEGVPPTQGRADQAWDSPGVGAHDGLECERAMEDQSYTGRTHGAQ